MPPKKPRPKRRSPAKKKGAVPKRKLVQKKGGKKKGFANEGRKLRKGRNLVQKKGGVKKAGSLESEVVAGGETIIVTLIGDTWVATMGDDNAITDAFIAGVDSDKAEATGWDAEVRDNMVFGDVARTSATVVTVTLAVEAAYDVLGSETITITIPDTALTSSGTALVASPTLKAACEGLCPLDVGSLMLMGVG